MAELRKVLPRHSNDAGLELGREQLRSIRWDNRIAGSREFVGLIIRILNNEFAQRNTQVVKFVEIQMIV